MRALLCHQFTGIDGLVVATDALAPQPGPGEITVRVRASGMNFLDTLIVSGKYQVKPPLPFSPGAEIAGEVLSVVPDVTRFKPGDRVCAFTYYGGFAEICSAKAAFTWHLPDAIDDVVAAASLITYGTSWFGLADRAQIQPGETCLVLGAAGGVGLAAIQVAKKFGAHVIAGVGSTARMQICRDHGADECIDYSGDDFRDRLKTLLAGRPLNVVVDAVGGAASQAALRQLSWRGRLLVIGFAAGEIPNFPANQILLRGVDVLGVVLDGLFKHEPDRAAQMMADLFSAIAAGALKPPVTEVLCLESAPEALVRMAQRQAHGKRVVTP
ncbi:MAG: NADPH:quinone oxidoreductase family protein [Betaproteobacteria bacterium]